MADETMRLLALVAERYPVEIECSSGAHHIPWGRKHGPCKRCGIHGGRRGRCNATAADLSHSRPNGWPGDGMAAWWEKYGERLTRWPLTTGDPWSAKCAPTLEHRDGHTPHAAIVAAACALVEGE